MTPSKGRPGPGPGSGPDSQIPLDQQSGPVELPPSALDRVQRMRGAAGHGALFSSDFSTNEFVLVKEAGFDPLGMVVGSSIYHVGYQPTYMAYSGLGMGFSYTDQELTVLSQAKYRARELAMSRMEAEALALGADGVVGVRLQSAQYEWGQDLIEFMAVGTAVRARGDGAFRTRFGKPFTSDLSGQDLRTLLQAGYRPLGLVMGASVYAAYQNGWEFQQLAGWGWGAGMTWSFGGTNGEIGRFTDALYSARELAMGRMQAEAAALDAEGIVGMQLTVNRSLSKSDAEFAHEVADSQSGPSLVWRTFIADVYAVGTAVSPLSADHEIPPPTMVVPLTE